MKKLRIAWRGHGVNKGVNGFGGGEHRYNTNVMYILEKEFDHEIITVDDHPRIKDVECDLVYDPPFEGRGCFDLKAPMHIHMRFCSLVPNHESEECADRGNCIITVPWRQAYNECLAFEEQRDDRWVGKMKPIYLPMPYPDDLLPAHAAVPGFDRNEIFWCTKDPFHPVFAESYANEPGYGHGWKVVNAGLCTLKALLRLQKKVDFKINFLMAGHLAQAPDFLGVRELLSQFKYKEFRPTPQELSRGRYWTPWLELLDILSRCKLNVPVGGLWGSSPETMFTKGLPMMHPDNMFHKDYDVMPRVEDVNEDVLYEIFERYWFDKDAYNLTHKELQHRFEEHRTAGVKRIFEQTFAEIGLN
jgi:hypothetical protein